jgi:hypothetical protein
MIDKLIRLLLELLGAIMLLWTCIVSFIHAKKGNDIAGITFGMAFFVLLVSKVVLMVIFFGTGFTNIDGSHINEYLGWYSALSYIPFALGCFVSIFASGKLSSAIWAPIILIMGGVVALPFVEKIMPVIQPFSIYGSFVWYVVAIILLATSLVYFFYNFKAGDRFRLMLAIGFLLLSVSSVVNIFSGINTILSTASMVVQFAGFFIIFYEVQFA